MNEEYRYEVAFSFLQNDEQLSLEIADRIRDRVSVGVFVYSERQDELAGSDGVEAFSKIFGEVSRIVVVLYREGWGQTRWTRVEENAIRARGFNEGHEFVLLVKLDSASPPVWLPPTRLYLGFERYGIDGVASAIEFRVQSAGGKVKSDNAADHALRLEREINFASKRNAWRYSDQLERAGILAAEEVVQQLKHLAEEINRQTQLEVSFRQGKSGHCVLVINELRLLLESYRPSLGESPSFVLHVWILDGGTYVGPYPIEEATKIHEARYELI